MPGFNSWQCTDCGVSYMKGSTHTCNDETIVKFQMANFEKRLGKGQGVTVTPRMQRRLDFYAWLKDNERL